MADDGVLARQQRLCSYIDRGALGPEVVDDLLADGEPLEFETALWDYKIDLPDFSADLKGDPALGRLIKTVASFYNSFGGYILAGVRDTPRSIVGYQGSFNCDFFIDILFRFLKVRPSCAFRTHTYHTADGAIRLGLLYIPARPPDVLPAEFRKTYTSLAGEDIFKAGQIYLRRSHASVPAINSDDYRFLMDPQRLSLLRTPVVRRDFVLDHNLPPGDGEFVEFVGRHHEMDELWRWFSDRFNPVKILTGIGGVGKTTLARAFAEQVAQQPPSGLEKIV